MLGLNGATPPSEKLNIAGVGVSGQGGHDITQFPNHNIVGLCDVDWSHGAQPLLQAYPRLSIGHERQSSGFSPDGCLAEMIEEHFKLNPLNLPQEQFLPVARRTVRHSFAGVHECERIPLAFWQEPPGQPAVATGLEHHSHARREFIEAWMLTHAMKPVFGVAIVRLAPVHDGVNVTAFTRFDVLRDDVGGVQVIVPEENGGLHQRCSISI